MLTLTLIGTLLSLFAQSAPPANAACGALTPQEVTGLIGAAKPMAVTNSPGGSSCMFMNGNKMITVLVVDLVSTDAAKGQWEAKKRVAAAQDVAGWPGAYLGTFETAKEHGASVGVVSGKRFIEARVGDVSQKVADLGTKLIATMKTASGRMMAK